MAEFSASPVTSPFANNALNVPAALAAGQGLQTNALANAGTEQALANQQTFRDNAGGLLARDPTATAAAFGANPNAAQAYLSALPQLDQNTRTQALQDMGMRASMAGAILNAPPDQRPALWAAGRQQLIASGAKNIPSETYPGDNALHLFRGIALTAQEQFNQQGQTLSATPQPPMQATPGGGYVGPGGVTAPAPSASNGGGLQGPLATSESGNDPTAVNAQGFAGTYQFGTARLADLGMYKPAQGENPNSNSWQGTLSIPGYPQVKTLADFRNNPDAQDAAYGAHINNIDQTIAATPGASNYDQSGLEAVAHLGGVAGMQKFVATGGKYDPADANGTKLSDYYRRFSGSAPAPVSAAAPVQVATATPTANGQPVATDASSSGSTPGFNAMLSGIRAPAPPTAPIVGNQPGTVTTPQPSQAAAPNAPGAQPAFPVSAGDPNSGSVKMATSGPAIGTPLNALQSPINPLAAAAPQSAGSQKPTYNALLPPPAGNTQSPAPGAAPTSASPAMPVATNPDAGKTPLYQGNAPAAVPGEPGYIFALDAQGNRTTMRMPGLPPPKGVDTKFVGGTMVQTDSADGHVVNVTPGMVPDVSRQTSVQGTNSDGTPGTLLFQDGKQVGFVPASTQPIQMEAYKNDLARSGQVAQQATDAEQQIQRALEARNYAQGLPTGAGGDDRAAVSTWLKTYAPISVYQSFVNSGYLPDAPQAQEAAKVMLSQAALDEKAMGGSGGLGLTEKYEKANPSLNMTPEAISAMSNLKAVTAQSAADYANGYLNYFKQNADKFTNGGKYEPAASFDQAWHSQPNVQTYLGAIDAMNGAPYSQWSKGLPPEVQQRALGVISRIDPTTVVNGQRGRIMVTGSPQNVVGSHNAAAPTAGSVQGGYRFNGGDPSNPASWGRVQ